MRVDPIGVEQYWGIDRFRRTMTVYLRSGEVLELTEGDVHRTHLLPGLELRLARLLARAGRYPNS
jgi:Uma2 family endonuclease